MQVFHSHCQLGNQMFIYACAHSLANKKGSTYCLSEIKDLNYFKLSKFEEIYNPVKYLWFRVSSKFLKYKFHHCQDNRKDHSKFLMNQSGARNWYYGYFQGQKYFYNNFEEVKKRFEIKSKYLKSFNEIKNKIPELKNYTVIHIRLRDYKTFGQDYLGGQDLSLPFSYYHSLIKSEVKKYEKIIFLSDEINKVKEEFSYVQNAYFSENDAITDFQFIMHAQKCILSCSTFSWWGAWLNKNENKKVFIPKYFLGHKVKKEYPVDVIPNEWIQIKVEHE